MAAQEKKERSSALRSFLAGGIAGAVEIGLEALPRYASQHVLMLTVFCSYYISRRMYKARPQINWPDYWLTLIVVAKTRIQLNHRLSSEKRLPWPPFGKSWYAGCTTMIFGNSLKAGIRKSLELAIVVSENGC